MWMTHAATLGKVTQIWAPTSPRANHKIHHGGWVSPLPLYEGNKGEDGKLDIIVYRKKDVHEQVPAL